MPRCCSPTCCSSRAGSRPRVLARDSFSTLLAVGLTRVFALQVFVIVGGVTRVIPLTGVTLPFISYGGSSIVANFVLLALLLLVSDRARRPARERPDRPPVRRSSCVLFALLIVWTSRWTVFEANVAATTTRSTRRTLIDELQDQARADLRRRRHGARALGARRRAAPGARSIRPGRCSRRRSATRSPLRAARPGSSSSRGDELRGLQTGLSSIFGQLDARTGSATTSTRRSIPRPSRSRVQQLAGRAGSVVALDPRTGAVKVMVRQPELRRQPPGRDRARTARRFNRSTQAGYPPGSTFKVVTATAAIDSGKYTPDSIVNGNSPIDDLRRAAGQRRQPELRPDRPDDRADLLGQHGLGAGRRARSAAATMTKYMKRFGFYSKPPLDYPPERDRREPPVLAAPAGRTRRPARTRTSAGSAIGQGGLLVTPLQMAMVAAAVANGGKLMAPHLTDQGRQPGRPHGRDDQAERLQPGDEALDRRRAHADDEERRRGGHRHPGPARRHQRRRQDRHRVRSASPART